MTKTLKLVKAKQGKHPVLLDIHHCQEKFGVVELLHPFTAEDGKPYDLFYGFLRIGEVRSWGRMCWLFAAPKDKRPILTFTDTDMFNFQISDVAPDSERVHYFDARSSRWAGDVIPPIKSSS